MDRTCYAYPAKRQYPIHTKEAALESFEEFKRDLPKFSVDAIDVIANNFVKAASIHDVRFPWDEIPEPRTVSFDLGDRILKISKIASVEDLDRAIDGLDRLRAKTPLNKIREVASWMWKEADRNNLDSANLEHLSKLAGFGVCNPKEVISEFGKRGTLISIPEDVKSEFYRHYRELNKQAEKDPSSLFVESALFSDILDDIDRMYKLQSYYGSKLQSPEDVCFKENPDTVYQEVDDYLRNANTDAILSKSALLESRDKVKSFLNDYYDFSPADDDALLKKVSSLPKNGLRALLNALE